VGGKTARESDGQGIRRQDAPNGSRSLTASLALFDRTRANELEQLGFQTKMRFPQFAIVDFVDAFPDSRIAAVFMPSGSEVPVIKAEHLRREPSRHVHAVRN